MTVYDLIEYFSDSTCLPVVIFSCGEDREAFRGLSCDMPEEFDEKHIVCIDNPVYDGKNKGYIVINIE